MSTTSASSSSKPSGGWQPPTLEEMQAMLPQYRFVSLLGRGGMGAVYKAVQVTLDRPVAIKVLPVALVDDDDSQFAERFKNEARTMAKMNHPAIVNVYDFGETNTGLLYIVMEFINGTDIAQMIATQGKLPEDYALSITAHVSDALNYAHAQGIIHRDIKPANILIDVEGAVKVADFGLAKANDASQSGITKTNMAMGTPDFVAPEAFIPGVPLDGRADLYAMGVMLYQMLTGEIPRGIWTMPSAKLGTDPRFDAIIAKAMQTDREHRYQSAMDLRMDLDTILTLPRAVLMAQQQAAAEQAARAAQKQREASSGPQRPPVSLSTQETPPPVKKKSSLVPLAGVVISVLLVAGVFQLLKKPEVDEGQAATAHPVEEAAAGISNTPIPPPPTTVAAPASTTQASGEGWVDGLAHIFADPKQSQKLRRQPDGSALVVVTTDMWPMAIEGPPLTDQAVRMTVRFGESNFTLSLRRTETDGNAEGSSYELKWLPSYDKLAVGLAVPNRGVKGIVDFKLPPGTDRSASHTLEFRAIGDQLTVSLDGQKIGEFKNVDVVQGFPHARFLKDAVIERLEYADLRGARADLTEPAAAVAGKAPSMPAPPAPAAPTTTVQSTLQPGWTDLLATADVARDTVQGRWEMKADGLHCVPAGGQQDYFKFDLPSPEEYDFEIEFTLVRGKIGSVSQMLVVPGHRFALVMNSKPSCITLGAHLDGKGWKEPERTEAITREFGIEEGRRMRSRVEIRRGTARVMIDDREVINWSGDFRRLNLHTLSYGQRHATQLAIACQNAEVVFHQARLHPISEAEKMQAKVPAPPSPSPAPAVVKDGGPSQWRVRKQGRSGWFTVASSADGNTLFAAAPGSAHTSTDSGVTWRSTSLPGRWSAAATSADASLLAVAGDGTSIFTSNDLGATWTERPSGVHQWSSLACSADGMQLVAVRLEFEPNGIPIHISKDGGATWTAKSAGGEWWSGVASSADGTHLVAVSDGWAGGGYIFVSHDSGETWSKRMTDKPRRWSSVASSADGTRLVAADGGFINGDPGHLYTSADAGETWVPRGPAMPWNSVASSASGHRLLAVVGRTRDEDRREGEIYLSTDFGESWEAQEAPRIWTSAASSADGTVLAAAGFSEADANQVLTLDLRSFATRAGNDPRLVKLEEGFRARYEADVEKPYLTAVAALNKSYVNNGIAKARAAAQSRGSLQEVVAFDEVKARIERGEGVPDVDDPDAPESLKSLRAIYRGALAKITVERDAKAAPLYDIYIGALDAYLAELKNAEKLEEFQKVTTLRQEIAARRPRLADAPTVEKKPAVAATATAPAAPKPPSGVSSWRAAAEFLIKNGGSFLASKSGVQVMVTKEDEIPSGRFDILEINLDRGNSLLPPLTDADFEALKGLRDLRRVSIIPSHPGLTAAAFAFLAGNDELLSLRVEGDPDFTSDKLAAVAGAKKLESIRIVNAPKFTGEGIDKLAGTGSIISLDLLECGINDEGMRAIAACKKLQALFCNSAAVTPGGFAAIAGLKSLTTLGAYGTPLDDEAADSLSRLTNLTSLDLSNTRIGDAGLQKLSALKKLTSLNLGGTQVTLEAAAAFQKANPQCRVSR